MKRLCIYSALGNTTQVPGRYVPYALRQYKAVADRLIVVTDIEAGHPHYDEINQLADKIVRSQRGSVNRSLHGYGLGFAAVDPAELSDYDEILFIDVDCYGPLRPIGPLLDDPERQAADFWSIGFAVREAKTGSGSWHRVMVPNFFSVNRRVATSREFQKFMQLARGEDDLSSERDLHLALESAGFKWHSSIRPDQVHTSDPLWYEAAHLVRAGFPIVLRTIFYFDPLTADMQAVDCRAALEAISETTDFDVAMVWESILPHFPLRMVQSNTDDLRVFESGSGEVAKGKWSFGGKVAVAAHIYYIDTLPEILELAANVPSDFDFFISTSSEENKQQIENVLQTFDCGGRKEVRVVEQNRGRDMSSLFITFRDVMLSGDYAWVLRLHSKRTPQMPWQIGQSFKQHLLENLAPSRRFVKSLFDLLEKPEYRNVGVVAPPVVHIGFGTLGHSWYSNRDPLEKVAEELNIHVPLDRDTPVATYGTMYWFRPKALEPMFRHNWKWEDYNAEPNHTDGGLAHVQERLICYCAQQHGFRTLAVMSTPQAERNYMKLEYKHQLLASRFPVRDIRQQYRLARVVNWRRGIRRYSRLLDFLERMDGRFHRLSPRLWRSTRGAVDVIWPILKGFER